MAGTRIDTYVSNGVEVEIDFDPHSGSFSATAGGKYVTNEKFANLKAAIDRATKSARVEVEVHVIRIKALSSWSGGGIKTVPAVLTGLHGANGNVLATLNFKGAPQKVQLTSERDISFVGGDTPQEDLREYNRLMMLLAETRKQIQEWERKHIIVPKSAVERAIAAKSGSDEA